MITVLDIVGLTFQTLPLAEQVQKKVKSSKWLNLSYNGGFFASSGPCQMHAVLAYTCDCIYITTTWRVTSSVLHAIWTPVASRFNCSRAQQLGYFSYHVIREHKRCCVPSIPALTYGLHTRPHLQPHPLLTSSDPVTNTRLSFTVCRM